MNFVCVTHLYSQELHVFKSQLIRMSVYNVYSTDGSANVTHLPHPNIFANEINDNLTKLIDPSLTSN